MNRITFKDTLIKPVAHMNLLPAEVLWDIIRACDSETLRNLRNTSEYMRSTVDESCCEARFFEVEDCSRHQLGPYNAGKEVCAPVPEDDSFGPNDPPYFAHARTKALATIPYDLSFCSKVKRVILQGCVWNFSRHRLDCDHSRPVFPGERCPVCLRKHVVWMREVFPQLQLLRISFLGTIHDVEIDVNWATAVVSRFQMRRPMALLEDNDRAFLPRLGGALGQVWHWKILRVIIDIIERDIIRQKKMLQNWWSSDAGQSCTTRREAAREEAIGRGLKPRKVRMTNLEKLLDERVHRLKDLYIAAYLANTSFGKLFRAGPEADQYVAFETKLQDDLDNCANHLMATVGMSKKQCQDKLSRENQIRPPKIAREILGQIRGESLGWA